MTNKLIDEIIEILNNHNIFRNVQLTADLAIYILEREKKILNERLNNEQV